MEFGSKFVYFYGDSDEESVSDDEYCAGIADDRYMLQTLLAAANAMHPILAI